MLGRGEDSCMGDKVSAGPGHHAALGKVVTLLLRVLGEPFSTVSWKDGGAERGQIPWSLVAWTS